MNTKDKDLSSLSYKELQSLAVKYRVPGNIKKYLLIKVLEAVRCGNEPEVDRILREIHQARKKKRLKKLRRAKIIGGNSTPMHSPMYATSEDSYYSQQQQPFHWVGDQEAVATRVEDNVRISEYDEFERLLLRRIQQDYQLYAQNEGGQVSSIVDLRMGAGSSAHEPFFLDGNNEKSNVIVEANNYGRVSEVKTVANGNGYNEQKPALLKKMLEAPAGANLGAIASPKRLVSYKTWKSENNPNCENERGTDSDTMTADSEVDNEDVWESSNNINNGGGYYCIMNNRNTSRGNKLQEKTFQTNPHLMVHDINRCKDIHPNSEVLVNCQKWIATNDFANREGNYLSQLTDNSRGFHPIYYDEISDNSNVARPINLERKNTYNDLNQNPIYDANQTILQEQISHDAQPYYQNNATNATINPTDTYYSQQIQTNQTFFGHGSYANNDTIHNVYQNPVVTQEIHNSQYNIFNNKVESCVQIAENSAVQVQYNPAGFYQQYDHQNNQTSGNFHFAEHPSQQVININQAPDNRHRHEHHQQQHPFVVADTSEAGDRKDHSAQTFQQPILNGALDPFWPRWPANSTSMPADMQLETTLNLRQLSIADQTRIYQTSCVYCCSTPIMTHGINVPSCTLLAGEKRLVSELRQHLFTPNRLVYNDSSTGMKMAQIDETPFIADLTDPAEYSTGSETTPDYGTVHYLSGEDSGTVANDHFIDTYSHDDDDDDIFIL